MSILVPLRAFVPGGQPSRTPYQVLDVSPDERDPKVIEEAALRCSSQVRAYQLTRESECALRLNEIAQALITLLDRDAPVLPQDEGAPVLLIDAGEACDVRLVCRRSARRGAGHRTGCAGETRPEN